MRVYFDSSALAKKYIEEPGMDEVKDKCGQAEEVLVSGICLPEIVSAFCRLRREGRMPEAIYRRLRDELAMDLTQATVIDPGFEVLAEAVACLEKTALRTLDAIHAASARHAQCDLFVSADKRQCEFVRSLGMKAEWVGRS